MHSRQYLNASDFSFTRGAERIGLGGMFPDWTPEDRIVAVAPEPDADTGRLAGIMLAWTTLFYDRSIASSPDFFDYPNHYLVGGERNAEPHIMGPGGKAEWSAAWCRLDVWPSTHHVVADPESATLMAAAFMMEPTILLWPARVPRPQSISLPAGPGEDVARCLMQTRVREVWLYGEGRNASPSAWRLEYGGGAGQLADEAADLLPAATAREPFAYLDRSPSFDFFSVP